MFKKMNPAYKFKSSIQSFDGIFSNMDAKSNNRIKSYNYAAAGCPGGDALLACRGIVKHFFI